MSDSPISTQPAERPQPIGLEGRYVTLRPIDPPLDGPPLWHGAGREENAALWDYMGDGPFLDAGSFQANLIGKAASLDPLFFAIVPHETGLAAGHAALMRIDAKNRVIEVGNILYTPLLQRTREASEAMYLLAGYVFERLGYRRYEWKCNSLNTSSRQAALRLGFTFEGIFRQHMIVKGRNRDTAWFSMLDSEWPDRQAKFQRWLDPSNFDSQLRQHIPLGR